MGSAFHPVLIAIAKQLRVEAADLLGFDLGKQRIALLDAARRADGRDALRAMKKLGLLTEEAGPRTTKSQS